MYPPKSICLRICQRIQWHSNNNNNNVINSNDVISSNSVNTFNRNNESNYLLRYHHHHQHHVPSVFLASVFWSIHQLASCWPTRLIIKLNNILMISATAIITSQALKLANYRPLSARMSRCQPSSGHFLNSKHPLPFGPNWCFFSPFFILIWPVQLTLAQLLGSSLLLSCPSTKSRLHRAATVATERRPPSGTSTTNNVVMLT